MRMNDDSDIDVKVFVQEDGGCVIAVDYPDSLSERVAGVMSLGVDMTGHPALNDLDANKCIEFYQGVALSRFRGV